MWSRRCTPSFRACALCHAVAHSGLPGWLGKNAGAMLERLDDKRRTSWAGPWGLSRHRRTHLLARSTRRWSWTPNRPCARCCCNVPHYLGREMARWQAVDAVARFHLGNGARVERLNWAAIRRPRE
jgi:malonyl-CoA decarboxylase